MKRRNVRIGLLALLAFALLAGALAMTSANYGLKWFTPGTSGGGGPSGSANYAAKFTVGQSVIGTSSSANYGAELGFWHGMERIWYHYLPIVIQNKTF